jgi:hypothetical protein
MLKVHFLFLLKKNFIIPFGNFIFLIWEQGSANVFLGLYIAHVNNTVKLHDYYPDRKNRHDFLNQQFLLKKFMIIENTS